MRNTCSRILLTGIVLLIPVARAAEEVSFTRDIRPLLSNSCFHCHGPDGNTREAGLRLDRREGLFGTDSDSGVVEPRHPDRSELIRRILSDDPDEMMPPPAANKPLSTAQRQLLVAWVQQGAAWQEHWAFVPPREPQLPAVRSDWARNEIDAFILQRLRRSGLHPASDAQPDALLRRLYLDLIGIPPEPADVDKWRAQIWPAGAATPDEDAYQRLIDELLASPHYGERWARRWLDLARYADTNGYEKDRDRTMWPYRDWVVNAVNSGMPFDEFTIHQLAGDMLPHATIDQRIATGFHRNTMLNEEGGIDPLEFRFHAMTDRVATTGTTWLGLTLGCCQCHTHKYDPISHREYYGLMAYLNNADEPALELPDEKTAAQSRANRERVAELIEALPQRWPDEDPQTASLAAAYAAWLTAEQRHAVHWQVLVPVEATSNLPLLTIQEDHSIFASGDTAKRDDYVIKLAPSSQPVTALRLEALPDSRLPHGGPGSTYYEGTLGDFFLTDLRAAAADQDYPFASATETYARNRYGKNPAFARLAIDDDIQTGWSVHQRQGERHVAVFQFREPVPPGTELTIQMTFGRHFASSLGRFRFSATDATTQPQARPYDETVAADIRAAGLATAGKAGTEFSLTPAFQAFLLQAPQLQEHTAEIHKLRKPLRRLTALVLAERPPNNPRPTFRHHRGEYLSPREQVTATIPQALLRGGQAVPQDRLGFARWLVSDANPLTARVTVNREWAAFFGTGLVRTLDDFGLQGEPPSHPQLLDWLAVTFAKRDAWSLRKLHRRIVSSSVYRQSVVRTPAAIAADPDNRLLTSAPRFRLDAEVLRDQCLAAASILNRNIGGPPVRPLQPPGVTEAAYGAPQWKVSDGDQRYRRSLYTYIKRTAPFAMFGTFDAPSGESCVARRNRSNSPLQALTLLNDVMLVDIARHAGARAAELQASRGDRATVTDLFRRLLVRAPDESELHRLLAFAAARREEFRRAPETARAFLHLSTQEPLDEETISHAVWASVARALFSLDEALVRP